MCTPFGYIISNHDGWIWSKPGGYSPVFIPSQMVRTNPEPVGDESYFTHIEFVEVSLDDSSAKAALQEIQAGYTPEVPAMAYRLLVRGSLGRQLVLYFFEWNEGSINGIWCGQDGSSCSSESMFMLLDMRKGS